jgi:signal transduction histidine kinase
MATTEPGEVGHADLSMWGEEQSPHTPLGWRRLWRYGRALVAPVLIWVLLVGALVGPVMDWLNSEDRYDRAAIQEWLEEARNPDATLSELVEQYHTRVQHYALVKEQGADAVAGPVNDEGRDPGFRALNARIRVTVKREEIYQHLRALGEPATKMYPGLLPLFPVIYRLEVRFTEGAIAGLGALSPEDGPALDAPIIWDSGLPRSGQYRETIFPLAGGAKVQVHYQLRAWNKRQRAEQQKGLRLRQLGLLAVAATALGLAWLSLLQSDEREQDRQRRLARERIDHAERQRLEVESLHAHTERQLLEQRLATQAAERQALELKSHLYASIGIMAGSYAHNIKNLLVRPNDLLRRCLEVDVSPEQERMLREVQQTLGTVTERLQQILHTVRRDPSQSEARPLDLNTVVRALGQTWGDLAADRWQLDLRLDLGEGLLWVSGDLSHLQQAVENLLFNARDATFEMRSRQREQARKATGGDPVARRQALIDAAGWRGRVTLRTRRQATPDGERIVLEVQDNGAGMTEEVRQRCLETHFSTKRDNALYEGHSTGMGLGLSFVAAILEHHGGRLEIESEPLRGATFRVLLPALDRAMAEAGRRDGAT